MNKTVRAAIKAAVPAFLLRRLRAVQHSHRFKEFYYGAKLRAIYPLLVSTGETHNFTYDLSDTNLRYLAETVGVATRRRPAEIEAYIQEAIDDTALRTHHDRLMQVHDGEVTAPGLRSPFGRRLGWYAVARAMKPRVVVETGVERGHGALLLCAALLRNAAEGAPGRYYGTDINPSAGWLLAGPYAETGKILYGDSIASLGALGETIDLFINDSDHSAEYEAREYEVIAPKLSPHAVVLGDNAHVTDKLARFSRAHGRQFLMFKEEPKDHWYPGAGIGISFPR